MDIIGSTEVVISSQTFDIGPAATPTSVTAGSRVFSVGPDGVSFETISAIGSPGSGSSSPITTTVAGVPVEIDGSEAVVSGTTFDIGPAANPTSIVAEAGGQTISIGPEGAGLVTTSVLEAAALSPLTTTIDGVPIRISGSQAVVEGTTFNIGPSARPVTLTADDGDIISIGPDGIDFDGTTLAAASPGATAAATAGGVTVSVGATEAVISGTTFDIGPSATSTTVVIDGETISIGPDGLGLASTTIPPATATDGSRIDSSGDSDGDGDGDDDGNIGSLNSSAVSLRSFFTLPGSVFDFEMMPGMMGIVLSAGLAVLVVI